MSEPLVMTCDIGTQSTRALLVDKHGNIVDMHQIKYAEPYISVKPGWAEQKTDFYYAHLCAASRVLCQRNADKVKDIIACTVTVIRDTLVFLDENMRPTRDILHWLDDRQCDFDDPFPWWKKIAFRVVGMGKATKIGYCTSCVNWVRQKTPEVWERTKKIVCLPAYLNYKLTGNLVDSVANTAAHIPIDFKNKDWMTENNLTRCLYDVPQEKLYEMVPPGTVLGHITEEASELTGLPVGIPLVGTGSDKSCETLGLSVADESKAAVSLGTAATVLVATKKYFEPQQFLPAYASVIPDQWNPEVQIFRGFWMLSWFIEQFGYQDKLEAEKLGISPEEYLDGKAAEVPAGCNGLLLQPYWKPDLLKPDAYGSILGFSDCHGRYHLYRAIIEGICLELYMSLKIMEKRSKGKVNVKEIYIGGGGSRSKICCQICADVFGLPVKRVHTHEACGIGASMVAFVAQGVYASFDEAIPAMVHDKDTFMPDEKNHKVYMSIYEKVYKKLYKKVNPLYLQMSDLKERNVV